MRRVPLPIPELGRYRFFHGSFMGMPYTVIRTGYTGEDGVEVILPAGVAAMGWGCPARAQDEFEPAIVQPAASARATRCASRRACRSTGTNFDEGVNPIEAGFAWCVDAWKGFIGAEAIRAVRRGGPSRRLIGLELEGKRIARPGAIVSVGGRRSGKSPSGTLGPTLQKSVAMAYVASEHADRRHAGGGGDPRRHDRRGRPRSAILQESKRVARHRA